MKVETQIKTLLKLLSQGIFEKEHILAMALLSAIAWESVVEPEAEKENNVIEHHLLSMNIIWSQALQ